MASLVRWWSPSVLALISLGLIFGCGSAATQQAPGAGDAHQSPAVAESDADAEPMQEDMGEPGPASEEGDVGQASGEAAEPTDAPAPSRRKAPPPSDDSRPTAVVAQIISQNRPVFKQCYEAARKKDPTLKGNVVLLLTLDAAGKLTNAKVDLERSSIKLAEVTDCMIQVAYGLSYPASSKGLDKEFEYDFGFNNHPRQ